MAAGVLDAALARQERCLPVIIHNLQLLVARAQAASLAVLAESVLLTASCPDTIHPSARVCRAALHQMLLAQRPSIQAAWPSALQRAFQLWMQHALQGLDGVDTEVDARDQPTATGSPISQAGPACSPAKMLSKRTKKRRLLAEGQQRAGQHRSGLDLAEDVSDGSTLSGSAAKKLKANEHIMEIGRLLQASLTFDKEASAEDCWVWTQALKAAQQTRSNSGPKPTIAHVLTAGVDSREQLDALAHLTSLIKYANCIAQTRLPAAVSSAMASLLLQASQKLFLQAFLILEASLSPRGTASNSSKLESSLPGQAAGLIDTCSSATAAAAAMEATAACLSALAALVACNRHAADTLAGLGSPFSRLLEAFMHSATRWSHNDLGATTSGKAAGHDCGISKAACRSISQISQAVMGVWLRVTGNIDQDADNAQAVDALMAWVINSLQQVRFATIVLSKAGRLSSTNRIQVTIVMAKDISSKKGFGGSDSNVIVSTQHSEIQTFPVKEVVCMPAAKDLTCPPLKRFHKSARLLATRPWVGCH